MDTLHQVLHAAQFLEEKKAEEVVVIDLQGLTPIMDYFLIASSDVQLHLDSLNKNLQEHLRKQGIRPRNSTREAQVGWVLLDYVDFVVHLFLREMREFYDLERIWGEGNIVWPTASG